MAYGLFYRWFRLSFWETFYLFPPAGASGWRGENRRLHICASKTAKVFVKQAVRAENAFFRPLCCAFKTKFKHLFFSTLCILLRISEMGAPISELRGSISEVRAANVRQSYGLAGRWESIRQNIFLENFFGPAESKVVGAIRPPRVAFCLVRTPAGEVAQTLREADGRLVRVLPPVAHPPRTNAQNAPAAALFVEK